MSVKTNGEEYLPKTRKKQIRILMALVILSAAILSAASPVSASGVPSKIITFTDKKIYMAWWTDSAQQNSELVFSGYDADFGDVYVYAIVLDDDGKIMKGRTITGNLNDIVEYDHREKANDAVHHNNLADPNLYDRTLIFNDTGLNGDGQQGDGIYTAKTTLDRNALGLSTNNPREENHIKLRVYANDTSGGLSGYTDALISFYQCMNGLSSNVHGGTHVGSSTSVDNCAVCHIGYEHFYENKSGTFADNQLDIHAQKWNAPDSTTCERGFDAYIWNGSYLGANTNGCAKTAEQIVPGSKYCYACHIYGSSLYDYDNTNTNTGASTRVNLSDKPSCNRPDCHSSTDMEGAPIIPWNQAGAVSGAGQNNYNIWRQKAHNHTTTSPSNVSCALCHLTQHGFSRPNASTTNLTLICQTCHNRTDGWLNVSKNQSHPKTTACKNCHTENNKLDVHTVPVGVFGGRWCMDCHKINGKAPIYIDEATINTTNQNYIHYRLNNKSDAANTSRICWGCHTNDTLAADNRVNQTELGLNQHPDNFTSPRKCLDCHNRSTGINFNAPQVARHTWFVSTMRTPAVTYCTNCHSQSESILGRNQSATIPVTDNESVSHYGKNRLDLEALIGQKAYCANCHQNESTVFGPFAKYSNKVRSDHASRITTPACSNSTCHREGALHSDTLVKPAFTEANIDTTCHNCHDIENYNFHNSTLTCWDCHLNDTAGNIHPIQFVQYNGNYTGAKLTAATCYNCHKTNLVDNTTLRNAGTTPPKIYSQSHSKDPINGTKWGDYWLYTPTTYQFASYKIIGNGSIDPTHPFDNIKVPSNDYMVLNETQTGRNFEAIFPTSQEDREFTASQGGWTGAIVSDPAPVTISGSYDIGVGNPAGSLEVTDTDSTANNQYSWTSPGFYYNGTGAFFKYANFSMERRRLQNDGTTQTRVTLVRPVSGNVVIYDSTAQTGTDASFTTLSVADITSYLTDNGTYKLIINTTYVAAGGAGPSTTYYDNVEIMVKEKVWNRYEIVINTTGVPVNGSSKLGMAYQIHKENTTLEIYNSTSRTYEMLDILDTGVFYDYTKSINSTYHIDSINGITGNVSVKFTDQNQNDDDAVTDSLHIRYLYVYTSHGLQYPCEQCHSPNKHYVYPTLGSPAKFSAGNVVNQSISSSGTWCQQCHWQGAANYSLMLQEFNVTRNPPENIPPEITNNATYRPKGDARDGTPYKDHTGFDLSDAGCFSCHGGSLSQSAGTTAFVHGVSEGVSGGPNCISCHNVGQTPPKQGALVNFTAMNDTLAVHKNLNRGSTSPSGYPAENYRCWACHGNGSEPEAGNHPSRYNNPYKCSDCHVPLTGQNMNFTPSSTLLNVTQHYWNGTNVSTSARSCYDCHNRSEMMLGSVDPDGAAGVYGGANGGNGSSSHYGIKRTNLGGYSQNTNGYCNYCHNTSVNNATFNVGDYNNTIFNHSSRGTTPLCSSCHKTGRIHNNTLEKPVSNDAYCSTCHGPVGSAVTNNKSRHKALNCTECHANNTVGTLAGKDIHAVKYLTQTNTLSTSNSSAVNCVTCHQTTNVDSSLSGFSAFKIVSTMRHSDNISNGSVWDGYWTNTSPQTACIYCHNNTIHNTTPLGRILNWAPNYKIYGNIGTNLSCSDCHYKGDSNYTQMSATFASAGLRTPPEITNSTNWKGNFSNYYNHSLDAYDDAACKNCHGSLLSGSANMTEFMHNAATGVAGGANCTACHNIGGTAGAGKLVNFSTMNDSFAIHKNLNRNAPVSDTNYSENRRCWACHGNGSEPSSHPANYRTPYNCTDCHVQGTGQNFNYTPAAVLNVTQHYWSGTSINTSAATTCYACHNKSEMMLGSVDPDGKAGVYGGANGGNNSTSHYGRKRTDYPAQGTNDYCYKCHNNASALTVFPYSDPANATIANHSISYPATNPACDSCHAIQPGRIHNGTLYKPAFALPNSTYCLTCHGSGGSATIKNLERHNSTSVTALNCTQCHLNSAESIHPARYLQQSGTWDTSKASAVNCTTCHQNPGLSGFETAPITPKPMNHSTNTYSGALWNGTQQRFWLNTSQQSSCDYCHGRFAYHNNSGLGNVTKVKGSNNVRQDLDTSRWCANCHYSGSSGYAGNLFYPEPPEITNASGKVPSKARDNTNFYNHVQDVATNYNDSKCKTCHNNALDAGATSLNFSHNLAAGGGGANCTSCHYIGGGVQNINTTAINDASSIHKDLNKDAQASDSGYNDSKKCWACHGDGKEPSGHPTKYKTPYNCTNCHVQGSGQNFNYTPNSTILNVTQHYWNASGTFSIRTPSATSCYVCHNTTGMIISAFDPDGASASVYSGANGGNDSVSHYGRKRSDMAAQVNTTPYCDNCHSGASPFPFIDGANRTIANHSLGYPATNPACKDCHDGGRIHNSSLYKTSLNPLPNATYCTGCHGTGGSASKNNLERHNSTGTYCSQCHLNASGSIHPVRYLQQDSSWQTSRSNAVNCTTCHQGTVSGFSSAPKVPVLAHSTNPYSGALWNGTQQEFWDNSTQQSGCDYCHGRVALHNLSGLGNITRMKGSNNVRQGFTGGYWCANCHYGSAAGYAGDRFGPQPPEVLNKNGLVPLLARDGTQFYNHSTDLASGWDDAKCKSCHDNKLGTGATSLNFTHSLGSGGGGPNCTSCHGMGGGLAEGKRINETAMNSSIHKDLNRNAQISDANYSGSRKCWACHGDGTEPSGHPARYKTPYTCVECHVPADGQNLNYNPNGTLLNVTRHYWNGTSINTNAATSCYICHNRTEMMVGLSLDPDGAATVYGGVNGGNNSTSHYGRKRTDYPAQGTNDYCNKCHSNVSAVSVYPYSNAANATIANHSMNYNATNPQCGDCHASGRVHNDTLYKPAFALPNSTYCLVCHGPGGSATIKNLEQHNGTSGVNCTMCHLSSTGSIHPVRYLRYNSTWSTRNGSAVNCTTCHQGAGLTNFSTAPLVQMPIWHSNNTYSGALWNGTQQKFWDNKSQQSSCDYCHGKFALHNSSGLGNSTKVQGTNSKNQSLTGSYWCANCHYSGSAPTGNYNYKGNLLNPVPPEIFNLNGLVPANASDGTLFQNHTTNIGGDWSDTRCKNCHGKDLPAGVTSATFVHRLNKSAAETGGPDCLKCHASTASMAESDNTPLDMRINKTAFINYSVHRNVNSNATSTVGLSDNRSKACWACHGDGTQPIKHPVDYFSPKPCISCHVSSNFNATVAYRHYPGAVFLGDIVYDSMNSSRTCVSCHNNSVVANQNISYGSASTGRIKNASVSHYTVNRSKGASLGTGVVTGVLPNTTQMYGCTQCHALGEQYGQWGSSYGNARIVPTGHNDMGVTSQACESACHNTEPVPVNLHNISMGVYIGADTCYSPGCHIRPTLPPGDCNPEVDECQGTH